MTQQQTMFQQLQMLLLLLLPLLLLAAAEQLPDSLRSYSFWNDLRRQSLLHSNSSSNSNSSTIEWTTLDPESYIVQVEMEQNATYYLADIPTFLPLSEDGVARAGVHNEALAVLLAMYHFNTRSSQVVEWQLDDCNIYFTLDLWDTQFSPIESTRIFTQDIWSRPHTLGEPKPAAVVGAYRSATTSPLAILTGVHDLPQISGSSSSTDFDIKEQFPRFGRTIGSSQGEAQAALQLYQSWNVTHVAVLFVTDAYGSALQKAFQDAAALAGIVTDSIAFSFSATQAEMQNAIHTLKDTQYRYVYAICFESHFPKLMQAAYQQGVAGPGFTWLFPGLDTVAFLNVLAKENTGQEWLTKAAMGMGILQFAGGFTGEPYVPGVERVPPLQDNPTNSYERFRTAWRTSLQDPEWIDYVQSQYPESLLAIQGWDVHQNFSQEPTTNAPYLYDAVFSLGLAMCQAAAYASLEFVNGTEIYAEFLQLDFHGASGHVTIDNTTGTRQGHPYLANNVRLQDSANAQFVIYPSAIVESDGEWHVHDAFVFADGTTIPHDALPPVQHDMNYIGTTGRAIGYTLLSVVLASAIVCWIWLWWNYRERVVQSSQPIFLVMICTGSFIMALSILPMGWEEPVATSLEGLDKACQAVPWLYLMGAVIAFSALFAKTRAIYQAFTDADMEFIVVTSHDIYMILGILGIINLILLVSWTIVAPLEWSRVVQDAMDTFGRPVESYGVCSNDGALVFVILVVVINLGLLLVANICAYQARNIETEYHESRYIAIAMASVLQAWCMGIPILIMVWDNPQAKFFVSTGIVFVTSAAILGLVYVPKMIAISQDRRLAAEEEKKKAFRKFAEKRKSSEGVWDASQRDVVEEAAQAIRGAEDASGTRRVRAPSPSGVAVDSTTVVPAESSPSPSSGMAPPPRAQLQGDPDEAAGTRRLGIKVLHNPRSSRNLGTMITPLAPVIGSSRSMMSHESTSITQAGRDVTHERSPSSTFSLPTSSNPAAVEETLEQTEKEHEDAEADKESAPQ